MEPTPMEAADDEGWGAVPDEAVAGTEKEQAVDKEKEKAFEAWWGCWGGVLPFPIQLAWIVVEFAQPLPFEKLEMLLKASSDAKYLVDDEGAAYMREDPGHKETWGEKLWGDIEVSRYSGLKLGITRLYHPPRLLVPMKTPTVEWEEGAWQFDVYVLGQLKNAPEVVLHNRCSLSRRSICTASRLLHASFNGYFITFFTLNTAKTTSRKPTLICWKVDVFDLRTEKIGDQKLPLSFCKVDPRTVVLNPNLTELLCLCTENKKLVVQSVSLVSGLKKSRKCTLQFNGAAQPPYSALYLLDERLFLRDGAGAYWATPEKESFSEVHLLTKSGVNLDTSVLPAPAYDIMWHAFSRPQIKERISKVLDNLQPGWAGILVWLKFPKIVMFATERLAVDLYKDFKWIDPVLTRLGLHTHAQDCLDGGVAYCLVPSPVGGDPGIQRAKCVYARHKKAIELALRARIPALDSLS